MAKKQNLILTILVIFVMVLAVSSITLSSKARQILLSKSSTTIPAKGYLSPSMALSSDLGNIPLYFIPNKGQVDKSALYYVKTSRHELWITKEGIVFDCSRLVFPGANSNLEIIPLEKTDYKVNYFLGNDPSRWKKDIPGSKSILFEEIYKKIDLKVYGVEKQVEYDWIIRPEGNPDNIRFEYKDIVGTEINKDGDLVIQTEFGKLVHKKPFGYQQINGKRTEVKVSFKETEEHAYSFDIGPYDRNLELIIDPAVLAYSTYLGGSLNDYAAGIAVDDEGNAYVTGKTRSPNFPTKNPYERDQSIEDAYVTKIAPSGRSLVYSTYLGGSDYDYALAIAIDKAGNAYVTGGTLSTNFPTKNPYQKDQPERDVFVTKLSPQGNALIFSTYLGGSGMDESNGIAVDKNRNVLVTGRTDSVDFPTLNYVQRDQPGGDAFVTKIARGGNSLVYSTYLGGNYLDRAGSVAVDSEGNAYVVGYTESTNFPLKSPFQKDKPGPDAFVTKLPPLGKTLVFSTYLGGNAFDTANGVAVDNLGYIYVTGATDSTNFPTKNPFQKDQPGRDAFVTKLTPGGNDLVYSTYLGGSDYDFAWAIAVDALRSACIVGETKSQNFPLKNRIQSKQPDFDAFVTKFSPAGNILIYSTYLGGDGPDYAYDVRMDRIGNVYVAGWTFSTNFPTVNPFQKDQPDGDAFVTKIIFRSVSRRRR
jgi:hypothetical protein